MSAEPTIHYHEDQHFRGSMLWGLIAITVLISLAAAAGRPRAFATPLTLTIVAGVIVLFAFARLETEVRDDAVYVHFHGIWPTRRIPLGEIAGYEAKRYTLWESGGWGVHLTLSGMAYNASGNHCVVFTLKNGRKVLVGTQRPQELAAAVAGVLAARRSPP